jgi:hypothetical protein
MPPEEDQLRSAGCWVEAACHLHCGVHRTVLWDISKDGCRAEMVAAGAAPGDRVLLQVTELLVLPATVGWVQDGQVGLRFASPMAGAMLGEFARRQGLPGDE